jgi:hypothetical protein
MTYLFFTNSLGQSLKSWKKSIDIILKEPTSKQLLPVFSLLSKNSLTLAWISNMALTTFYIIQQLPLLPLPPKETHRIFFHKTDSLG